MLNEKSITNYVDTIAWSEPYGSALRAPLRGVNKRKIALMADTESGLKLSVCIAGQGSLSRAFRKYNKIQLKKT